MLVRLWAQRTSRVVAGTLVTLVASGAPALTLDSPPEDSPTSRASRSANRGLDLTTDEIEARLVQETASQQGQQDVSEDEADEGGSQEEIEKFREAKKAAKQERIEQVVEQDQSGNDPRVFTNKWMPFYRHTELNGGLVQQDLTAFGTVGFSQVVGMFYELPLAQHRDLSGVPDFPPDIESAAIGVGC